MDMAVTATEAMADVEGMDMDMADVEVMDIDMDMVVTDMDMVAMDMEDTVIMDEHVNPNTLYVSIEN